MKTLPRIRARSCHEKAKSTSCSTSNISRWPSVSSGQATSRISSPPECGAPSIGSSLPSTRIRGAEFPDRSRSEPPWSHSSCSQDFHRRSDSYSCEGLLISSEEPRCPTHNGRAPKLPLRRLYYEEHYQSSHLRYGRRGNHRWLNQPRGSNPPIGVAVAFKTVRCSASAASEQLTYRTSTEQCQLGSEWGCSGRTLR